MPRLSRPQWPASELPRILVAGRFPMEAANQQSEYRHITFAIHQHFYRGSLEIGSHRFELHSGDITVTPPDIPSRYRLESFGYHWTVHFAAPELCEDRISLPLHVPAGRVAHLGPRLDRIVGLYQAPGQRPYRKNLSHHAARAELLSLILALALLDKTALSKPKQTPSGRILDGVKESLDRRFGEDLSSSKLAAEAHLSPNYLTARFRQRFGMTIPAYLLQRRIDLARHLLLATDKSVKEIAFIVGIPDPHYFNKQFRRIAGVSPTLFRSHGPGNR